MGMIHLTLRDLPEGKRREVIAKGLAETRRALSRPALPPEEVAVLKDKMAKLAAMSKPAPEPVQPEAPVEEPPAEAPADPVGSSEGGTHHQVDISETLSVTSES